MQLLRLLPLVLLMGCSPAPKQAGQLVPVGSATSAPSQPEGRLQKLPKLLVTGDFDGDHRPDTVYQHVFSGRTQAELDSFPSPFYYDWDTTTKWLADQQADVWLTLHKPGPDTLHLGTAQGLYCLLNLGDTNADGKDEIAFVVDYYDASQLNTCYIITLCQQHWQTLKQFGVHERAFEYSTATAPVLTEIDGFLAKRNRQWFYADYKRIALAEQENDEVLQKLTLGRCK